MRLGPSTFNRIRHALRDGPLAEPTVTTSSPNAPVGPGLFARRPVPKSMLAEVPSVQASGTSRKVAS